MVDFKNTVIIMTTNLGTRDISKGVARLLGRPGDPLRLRPDEGQGHRRAQAALPPRVPQPRGRHHRLPAADPGRDRRRSSTSRSPSSTSGSRTRTWAWSSRVAAKNLLAKKGYDPVLGARPLRRTIQREIEDVLSEKILFGELQGRRDRRRRRRRARARTRRSPSRARRTPGRSTCPSWRCRTDPAPPPVTATKGPDRPVGALRRAIPSGVSLAKP